MNAPLTRAELQALAQAEGFADVGISHIDLAEDETRLLQWLDAGRHGEMDYMARHGTRRSRPAELLPGTLRVISARMDYWPGDAADAESVLADPRLGYVSRYALGRDYHKVMRAALARLAGSIAARVPHQYRVFVDSAPVLEKALARNAGLGWIGKHTNLITRDAGSYYFLGEIYTDLPLEVDAPASAHCGTCTACMPACPTQAIVAPYQLDARRCISYLTIELQGQHPGRAASGHRQSHLRLRRLPARVSVEQVRARGRAAGLQGATSTRCAAPDRTGDVDTRRIRAALRRKCDTSYRLRGVPAQCDGGAGQRAGR